MDWEWLWEEDVKGMRGEETDKKGKPRRAPVRKRVFESLTLLLGPPRCHPGQLLKSTYPEMTISPDFKICTLLDINSILLTPCSEVSTRRMLLLQPDSLQILTPLLFDSQR